MPFVYSAVHWLACDSQPLSLSTKPWLEAIRAVARCSLKRHLIIARRISQLKPLAIALADLLAILNRDAQARFSIEIRK